MFESNNFLEITLFIALIIIIALCIYHNTQKPGFIPSQLLNSFNNATSLHPATGLISNDIELPHNNNKIRLLTNQRGIKIGFHEQFRKVLPELGWRSFYLNNFSGLNNIVKGDKMTNNMLGTNYLSCLDNTNNVYKYVDY